MSTTAGPFNPTPTLIFCLKNPTLSNKFAPRLGQLNITRPAYYAQETTSIELLTPGLICSTTRGIVQHLSRDNVKRTTCVKWVHVPFESFLQTDPPIPTRQEGIYPLHTFLGFSPSQHIVSLSLRDPADGREMPPNGKQFLVAQSSRGTRKVTDLAYRSYITAIWPDVVFPMSDVPFTLPPHSQKRTSKSIERSTHWLSSILAPVTFRSTMATQNPSAVHISSTSPMSKARLNVFLHMVGGIKPAARAAFASALLEPLEPNKKALVDLEMLDHGISGYVFDLVPLRTALLAEQSITTATLPASSAEQYSPARSFAPLIRASLNNLPAIKPRLVNTALSPHEILVLVRDAGIDLFDTFWAQQAATWGVALDFQFPVRSTQHTQGCDSPGTRNVVKCEIGHNLYESRFAHDFTRLADCFLDGLEQSKQQDGSVSISEERVCCGCAACSPIWNNGTLVHSAVDKQGTASEVKELAPPYTRAYLHHLLHTHEMSAHSLLVMHNLTVMDSFMRGVRDVLQLQNQDTASRSGEDRPSLFELEIARFGELYDARLGVLDRARACWGEVDRARGKGRLGRERERQKAKTSGH
ncbi:hypothetical protein K439DRAFT_1647791 [Ramaria rubella]|nr:hypothetical protein K439DRAFT_1647791 [Ramaria rubella]